MARSADRRRIDPLVPDSVAAGDQVLKDCYDAAVNGLVAADQKKRGAKEKLAYIVARIEREVYPEHQSLDEKFAEDKRRRAA